MTEKEYMHIQCKGCNEYNEQTERCKFFEDFEERRCFVNCVIGRIVKDKDFNSFDIKFGNEKPKEGDVIGGQ